VKHQFSIKEENMEDIRQLRKDRKLYNLQMFRSGISTFRELEEMEAKAFADGALSQKHKELIGLGIGIVGSCYG
jgi:hypothetical protein